ncbi:MAG: AraC family transcriptional regulator [Opitutaceae bacterium]|jgi:AraC-like DNA-binding protein|nr:AraC family transcriptional regulator [Opitutaceae bacterium]
MKQRPHTGKRNARVMHVNYTCLPEGGANCWPERRLGEFELILSVRGDFELVCHETGERVIQRTGDILVIYPGELHTYRVLSPARQAFFSCIHYAPPPGEGGTRPPRLTHWMAEHAMGELFRRADHLRRSNGLGSDSLLAGVVHLIWLYLLEPPRPPPDQRLSAMLDFLETHLAEHPTRRDLARRFRMTPQRINALFKDGLGLSPGKYVHRELVRRACALLRDDRLSVKETANRLGFANPFHFSRVFKKTNGHPPSGI